MRIDKVVINASPLISLFRSELHDLLPALFQEIVIPGAVWNEVLRGGHEDKTSALRISSWAIQKDIGNIDPVIAAWDLGKGESEVLTFVLRNPDFRAMVDDRLARSCARSLGIKVLGTGGALILAKRRKLIDTVSSVLDRLRNSGLWLSDDLIQLLKKEAGEK